ncbi:hydrolase [Superficieibacter electus]|uniref:Hydrolase n=1 Tax=Superficieibacter electus TaxID=2022662 RepID=A0A2P5GPU4_9ENTR|nr:alpha/beta fold hydrolase [Superficieibacter electus]POP45295.1 hydrolase [Superficieibacter electus]POP48578.1 hydrolase [Superficieibacter electus]
MEMLPQSDAPDLNATAVIQAWFSAFAEGKIDDAVALLDENVVWHIDGDPAVSTIGLLRGPEQVRRWLENFPRHFRPQVFTINDMIEHHGHVLALGRFRHTVLSTGNTVGSDMIIHFTVAGSKITRYQIFEDSALLSRAFASSDNWQRQEIRVNGTLYRYWDRGEGPTLIFAHGLFVDHTTFAAQVEVLRRSWRCIVLDMPGHGESGYNPEGWTLDDISQDLALMIQEMSLGKVTFIGQSQGGMTGLRLAASDPQLLSGLVLIGTSARAEFPERLVQWNAHRETLLTGTEQAREALFATLQQHINAPARFAEHPSDILRERALMMAHDRTGLVQALDAAVFKRGDVHGRLNTITVPTLVICGESDTATPVELSQELAAAIPAASLLTLPGTGHHPESEAAQAVTHAIEQFLLAQR